MKFGSLSTKGTLNIEGYLDIINSESYHSNNDYFFITYGDINLKDNSRLNFDIYYMGIKKNFLDY